MDIQNLLLISKYIFIITITFDAIVFIFILLQKNLEKIHRSFLIMLGLFLLWEITLLGAFSITSSVTLNWWSDFIAFVAGALAALSIVFFLEIFYGKKILSNYMRGALVLISIIDIVLVYLFMMQRIQIGQFAYDFYIPNSLPLILYYVSFLPVSICIAFASYIIYQKSTGLKKKQALISLTGLLIAFIVASITCIWFPLFFDDLLKNEFGLYLGQQIVMAIEFFGGLGFSFFTGFTAYAITRHRLFDIHVVIQNKYIRAVITIVGFIAVFTIAYIVMLITNNLFIFILIALVGTVLAQFGFNAFFKKFLTQSAYDFSLPPELELLDDSQAALDQLFEHLQRDLRNDFGIEECVIYMYDRLDKQYRTLDAKPKLIPESHALVNLTNFKTEVVTRAQLEQSNNTITMAIRNELLHFFDKNGYSMALPLYNPVMNYGFVGITRISESAADFNNPFIREKLLHLGEKYGYYLGQILAYEAMVGPSAKK